jgi:tetratricopeptide (TPR) repeat protein
VRGPGLRALSFALFAAACASQGDILARGQAYYEDNQYERALAVWRELSRHEPVLTPRERARYAYLRGMTAYRLGFRDDARHWLAMAKVTERRHPASLDTAWMARLDGALDDLNREILGIRSEGTDPVQSIEAPTEGTSLEVPPRETPTSVPPSSPAPASTEPSD